MDIPVYMSSEISRQRELSACVSMYIKDVLWLIYF